jgi:1-deoxy-D-xylulose-5-phosphate reductoisomerase
VVLTANSRVDELVAQAKEFSPKLVIIGDESRYQDLKEKLTGTGIEVAAGIKALAEAASYPSDFVMAGIVGAAGLRPTLNAVRRGAIIGLANKECLVCAGDLFMAEVKAHGATLLPVDSEHNAIFQVFDFENPESISKIILTASGGPFRTKTKAEMAKMTAKEAVKHPNWDMGAKISIDSATLMNKGLELIEAYHLFPIPAERIDIVVHPQSVVHSMVEYIDGSVLAQLGSPDMRTPIAFAMNWPKRLNVPVERLNLAQIGTLNFENPDEVLFPALKLARTALKVGGSTPTVLNAANEIAVAEFIKGNIGFLDIATLVEKTMDALGTIKINGLDDVFELDNKSRITAQDLISTL